MVAHGARFARSWAAVHEGLNLASGVGIVAVMSLVLAQSSLSSFLIVDFAQALPVRLLIPVLAAFLIGFNLLYTAGNVASAAPRLLRWWRVVWLLMLVATYAAAANAGCLVAACQPSLVTRNLVLFAALTALGSTLLGPSLGWLPLMLYGMTFLFFGQRSFGAPGDVVRGWAIPMQSDLNPVAVTTCVGIFLAATVTYGLWGSAEPGSRPFSLKRRVP